MSFRLRIGNPIAQPNMRSRLALLLLISPLACQSDSNLNAEPEGGASAVLTEAAITAAAESITPEELYARVAVLADDSMRGRYTPSPEIEMVATWAASEFQAMGLQPGGDAGTYIQHYAIPARRGQEPTGEMAPNVVAILQGSDPVLRDEYVVFSAHMDHVGVGSPDANGDSIRNGADDDASGTATVMEIAEAMAALPVAPRRSMIFVLVSGEERGLWGSEHFANNAPVATDAMVANMNIDMVGRNWTDTIVAIGKEHSDLGETLNRVNAAHPEIGMTAIDDIWPDERFYFRSDHYNFAVKGVPILFFFNGTHEDYHRASDELDKIDTEKMARIGRLVFYLGLDVAQADNRPVWNPESYQSIVEGGNGG